MGKATDVEANQLIRRIPQQFGQAFIDLQQCPLQVGDRHAKIGLLENVAKTDFTGMQGRLDSPALGNVAYQRDDRPLRTDAENMAPQFDPNFRSIVTLA
ncbi:hypothetical protein GALL_537240 [mine drainage metagenome]|uniref:Uncharacterized protein n=1 Tax=mine drainage metagenome TaxID=410659 RepID=A0A1J5PMC9_9ZZZZ